MKTNSRRNFLLITAATTLSLGIPLFLASCGKDHEEHSDSQAIYTCSMHPQIRSKKPGRCPICGMNLTPLAPKQESTNQNDSKNSPEEIRLMPAQDSVASIVVESAGAYSLVRSSQIYGEIQPVRDTTIDYSWVYSGRVEKIKISYNTTEISKGRPILEIYSEEAVADQQAYLQAVRERYLTTFYERKVATAQIEIYRAKLLQAGMSDEELENLLKNKIIKTRFVIKAPSSGSLTSPLPSVGERITSERTLFRISALDKVWFVGKVFEHDISALSTSNEIEIESKARPGLPYRGRLVFIDRVLDPETRTIQARFEINNPKRELLPDMSATGKIQSESPTPTIAVPASSIIDTGKRKILYVRTQTNTYQQREVTTGNEGNIKGRDGLYVEIQSGLKQGEQVVTSGAFLVDAEAQLRGSSSSHQHGEK